MKLLIFEFRLWFASVLADILLEILPDCPLKQRFAEFITDNTKNWFIVISAWHHTTPKVTIESMIEGGILEKLTKKKRKRGLDEAETAIIRDLQERGEPDLNIYLPEEPMAAHLTKRYVEFAKSIIGKEIGP